MSDLIERLRYPMPDASIGGSVHVTEVRALVARMHEAATALEAAQREIEGYKVAARDLNRWMQEARGRAAALEVEIEHMRRRGEQREEQLRSWQGKYERLLLSSDEQSYSEKQEA